MPSPVPPFAVQLDEGVTLKTPTAGDVIVRADTAQTNASLTVLEFLVPPNDGPAVHAHLREDEVWYVTEGRLPIQSRRQDVPSVNRRHGVRGPGGCRTRSRTSAASWVGCW